MGENIEAVRQRISCVRAMDGDKVRAGIIELLALYDRTQTDVGKAEAALVRDIHHLGVLDGDDAASGIYATRRLWQIVREYRNAFAAEGGKR